MQQEGSTRTTFKTRCVGGVAAREIANLGGFGVVEANLYERTEFEPHQKSRIHLSDFFKICPPRTDFFYTIRSIVSAFEHIFENLRSDCVRNRACTANRNCSKYLFRRTLPLKLRFPLVKGMSFKGINP